MTRLGISVLVACFGSTPLRTQTLGAGGLAGDLFTSASRGPMTNPQCTLAFQLDF